MGDQEQNTEEKILEIEGDSGLDQVVENMSSPSPDVVSEEAPRLGKEDLRDPKGRPFDPELHLSNPDGSPKINVKTGKICLKPGPEKKKLKKGLGKGSGVQGSVSDLNLPPGLSESRMAAAATVDAIGQVGILCFGNEWQFMKNDQFDERENLIMTMDRYYQVKGVRDIPPGLALTIALGGYVLARLRYENTRSKFGVLLGSIRKKANGFMSFIGQFFKRVRVKNASHIDSRDNGNGQDDASGRASEPLQAKQD